jgi:hypothetical protein
MRTWKETCIIARWLRDNTELDAQEIADKLATPIDWMLGLLGLPIPFDAGLPPTGSPVVFNGIGGLIRHTLRNPIAPSGVLVAIYRYGEHGNYIGYVDSSQIGARET